MTVSILRLRWPAWSFPSQFRGPSNLQGQVCVSGFSFLPSVSRAERTSCWEVACDLLSFVLSVPSLQGRLLMAWGTRGPEGVPDSGSSRSDAGLAGTPVPVLWRRGSLPSRPELPLPLSFCFQGRMAAESIFGGMFCFSLAHLTQ